MQLEVSRRNSFPNPYCAYAPGHPYSASPDPDGISFAMLIGEGALESDRSIDELYVDFHPVSGRSTVCFETDMVRYVRDG